MDRLGSGKRTDSVLPLFVVLDVEEGVARHGGEARGECTKIGSKLGFATLTSSHHLNRNAPMPTPRVRVVVQLPCNRPDEPHPNPPHVGMLLLRHPDNSLN